MWSMDGLYFFVNKYLMLYTSPLRFRLCWKIIHCRFAENSIAVSTFRSVLVIFLFMSCFNLAYSQTPYAHSFVPDSDNVVFRNEIIHFVRAVADHHLAESSLAAMHNLDSKWANHYQKTRWNVTISLYHRGIRASSSHIQGSSLSSVLQQATANALNALAPKKLSVTDLDDYRFEVDFDYYPRQQYAVIEYGNQGLELLGNRVPVRHLTVSKINHQLARSQDYLLRLMDQKTYGYCKFYNAYSDEKQLQLRTVYSASSLYTLLQLDAWRPQSKIEALFKPMAQFIISNQITTGPQKGGFYYAIDPLTQQHTCRVVVGTAAKSIFALLAMHQRYPKDSVYLDHAKQAGDWLIQQVDSQGHVIAAAVCYGKQWQYNRKQSLLYSGQVLSALSRLYHVTQDRRYLLPAKHIADHFMQLVATQGPLLGDDYRPANSISSSWILMSLLDYVKIDTQSVYLSPIYRIARMLLSRQITNRCDIYNHGRYLDAMTASGNGWINEVMGNFYHFCKTSSQKSQCQPYYQAILATSRWLLQNSFTPENAFAVKNPARALGGMITNFSSQTVRTDAVCHSVNSLLLLESALPKNIAVDQKLINIPERALIEILPLLRAGTFLYPKGTTL